MKALEKSEGGRLWLLNNPQRAPNVRDKAKSTLTACEATWRYLLRSSALTKSSGTVFPLYRNEETNAKDEVTQHRAPTVGPLEIKMAV